MKRSFYTSVRQRCQLMGIFIMGILLTGCPNVEPFKPGMELVIKVVDSKNRPVPNAKVVLYTQERDLWDSINQATPVQQTITNGKVLFSGLPVDVNSYYVEATFGKANNLDGSKVVRLVNDGAIREYTVVVKESIADGIAGRESKTWKQVYYELNGSTNNSCIYKRSYKFIRTSYSIQVEECDGRMAGTDVWSVAADGYTVTLGASMYNKKVPTFLELTATRMKFTYKIGNSTVIEAYEAVK